MSFSVASPNTRGGGGGGAGGGARTNGDDEEVVDADGEGELLLVVEDEGSEMAGAEAN